jgi:16S rRNA (cytidine1402-2'-O)-methyltransferase
MNGSPALFVVSGPIGNMKDITYRAIDVLNQVDLILSEDTRETAKILTQHNISKPQISYRDQNHDQVYSHILSVLQSGSSVALLSDSGTPVISDPGFKLVRELKKAGITVVPIPGANAAVSALSVSGLPSDKFIFLGFLPKKDNQRKDALKTYGVLDATLVIYESPYRVKKLLEEVRESLGDRVVCLAKDLTKVFESVRTAPVSELLSSDISEKGEYVVLIAKEDF